MGLTSCETYQDYEVEYSPSYPVSGNYFVKNYVVDSLNFADAKSDYYEMYIYSASFDADKYVWVNTQTTLSALSYVVKTTYDAQSAVFDGTMLPHSPKATPPETPLKYVTLEQTKIIRNTWPAPDSIILKISIFDENQVLDTVFYSLGHRTTGQDNPYWDNPTGK